MTLNNFYKVTYLTFLLRIASIPANTIAEHGRDNESEITPKRYDTNVNFDNLEDALFASSFIILLLSHFLFLFIAFSSSFLLSPPVPLSPPLSLLWSPSISLFLGALENSGSDRRILGKLYCVPAGSLVIRDQERRRKRERKREKGGGRAKEKEKKGKEDSVGGRGRGSLEPTFRGIDREVEIAIDTINPRRRMAYKRYKSERSPSEASLHPIAILYYNKDRIP